MSLLQSQSGEEEKEENSQKKTKAIEPHNIPFRKFSYSRTNLTIWTEVGRKKACLKNILSNEFSKFNQRNVIITRYYCEMSYLSIAVHCFWHTTIERQHFIEYRSETEQRRAELQMLTYSCVSARERGRESTRELCISSIIMALQQIKLHISIYTYVYIMWKCMQISDIFTV